MPAAIPPAAMVPMLAMNHSAELKPMMLTHRCGPNPSDSRLFPNLGRRIVFARKKHADGSVKRPRDKQIDTQIHAIISPWFGR